MSKLSGAPGARKPPTRAEFERLRNDCEHLRHELASLRESMRRQSTDLRVQFTRIAEMQAVLDHEGRDPGAHATTPRPLFRAPHRES